MMGANHAVGGAAAWVAVTSTAPYTLGLDPLPVISVLLGALVTAGAALLPDVDQHSSTIANSGGLVTRSVAAVAGAVSGGHRHGTHSILAIAAFTFGTVLAGRWEAVVPVLGLAPIGSALMLLALIAFATKAVRFSGGGGHAVGRGHDSGGRGADRGTRAARLVAGLRARRRRRAPAR
jgi:membrane-bound metal-dependent hydrolase YbcI (DUF457 family)